MIRAKRIVPAVAVASLALLAGAWAWRNPEAPLQAIGRAEVPGEEARSAPLPTTEPEGCDVEVEFWTAIASEGSEREAVLRLTKDFLGLSPDETQAFRSAAEDVDRAWEVREAGWIAVQSSAVTDPELVERQEEEIQSRYESEKDRALQRVAAQLTGSDRREQLRERLEEWFDALR